MKNGITLILLFFSVSMSKAQINPPQGSKLNYTQIMFEYERVNKAGEYVLQVAVDDNTDDFKNPIVEQKDSSTATIISDLKFGEKYKWRYAGVISGKRSEWKGPYNFQIVNDTAIGLDKFRFRVLKNDKAKNTGGLLSIGSSKMIIDRDGNPVWYMPLLDDSIFVMRVGVHDIRISNSGTIVFLSNNTGNGSMSYAYECDLNGKILWSAPNDGKVSNDTCEFYNHDFRRLNNNNYMVIGAKYTWRKVPPGVDLKIYKPENIDTTGSVHKVKVLFNTLIEYNKKKEVVWKWNSADYLSDADLFCDSVSTSNPRRDLPARAEIFGHMNAFDTDPKGEYVYASFRDISRVVKISKKLGKVVDSWGEKMASGEAIHGHNFFDGQHDLNLLPNGNLCLFNNNVTLKSIGTSKAIEFTQSSNNKPSKIVWSFDCKFDSLTNGKSRRFGGVDCLKNNNMLICMGLMNRITEIAKDKKEIVWDCFYEYKNVDTSLSNSSPLYRVHNFSSLYPCYFTIQEKEKKDVANAPYEIKIFNEGTNSDSYIVNVILENGSKLIKAKTDKILPGNSRVINVTPPSLPPDAKSFNVLVTSNVNPDLFRMITIQL